MAGHSEHLRIHARRRRSENSEESERDREVGATQPVYVLSLYRLSIHYTYNQGKL